ncbi:RsmB/NOP family class I SAM-dependent RNA methyltransferase [Ferruginibacter sp.]
MRYQSYLNTTGNIIEMYQGQEPLSIYLKKFFGANKKYGSKDRKYIASLCYAYFRFGKAAADGPLEENILAALFLSESSHNEVIHFIRPEWDEWIARPLEEKIAFLQLDVNKIFPYKQQLSAAVNHTSYCTSFLQQPKLFLRVRPNKKNIVVQKLQKAKIPLTLLEEDCIALSNATKLDDVIETDREAVIQDYNSQQVFNFLQHFTLEKNAVTAWDCCAASGGKSILLFDTLKRNVELTVSDIRLTILLNLHQRFNKAGIKNYNYFLADLTDPAFKFPELATKGTQGTMPLGSYQMIVCDAPCTGSGTWSRTPENLFYFKETAIDDFAARQQQIVSNVIPYLQTGGLLFYITCSVFKKENEDVANFIKEKFHLQLLQMELLKGYNIKADSMFVAVFTKP